MLSKALEGIRFLKKQIRKFPNPFARKSADSASLSEEHLRHQSLQNMKAIAVAGLVLIVMDLFFSFCVQDVKIVKDGDTLYLVRPAAGESAEDISLNARVQSGKEIYEDDLTIHLQPQQSGSGEEPESPSANIRKESVEDMIRSEFRSVAAGFNEDLSLRLVPLPTALDTGEPIHWSRATTTNTLLLVILTSAMMILVYRSRFRPMQKLAQIQKRSVLCQLPAFLNELVLLLNAGLVLSSAFETTVERTIKESEEDYFRSSIRRIYDSMKQTNAAMHEELRSFAKSSGVSELMRVSSIISDNISKGAELNEKLERESQRLWLARKLDAEERGRLAETKMTIPLSIFLCVLIIITVSPALLQL